jgi:hypothetical protein
MGTDCTDHGGEAHAPSIEVIIYNEWWVSIEIDR